MGNLLKKVKEYEKDELNIFSDEDFKSLEPFKERELLFLGMPELYMLASTPIYMAGSDVIKKYNVPDNIEYIEIENQKIIFLEFKSEIFGYIPIEELNTYNLLEILLESIVENYDDMAVSFLKGVVYNCYVELSVTVTVLNPEILKNIMREILKYIDIKSGTGVLSTRINDVQSFGDCLRESYKVPVIQRPRVEEMKIRELKEVKIIINERMVEIKSCLEYLQNLQIRLKSDLRLKNKGAKKTLVNNLMTEFDAFKSLLYIVATVIEFKAKEINFYYDDIKSRRELFYLENYRGVYDDMSKLMSKVDIIVSSLMNKSMHASVRKLSLESTKALGGEKYATDIAKFVQEFENILSFEESRVKYIDFLLKNEFFRKEDYFRYMM